MLILLSNFDQKVLFYTPEDVPENYIKRLESSKFINHESYCDCEPSSSNIPVLERMRKGYR